MALVEVRVPDIGDFKDVAVIELLVKPGDTVKAEQSLITVESDKASMEIPSSADGVVKELKVEARRQGQRRIAAAAAGGRQRRGRACERSDAGADAESASRRRGCASACSRARRERWRG